MRRIRQLVVSSVVAVSAFAAVPAASDAAALHGCRHAPVRRRLQAGRPRHALPAQRSSAAPTACARCAWTRKLNRAARGHARDMVAKRYFDHDSRNGATFDDPHQAHRLDQVAPLLHDGREHRLGRRLALHAARRWSAAG